MAQSSLPMRRSAEIVKPAALRKQKSPRTRWERLLPLLFALLLMILWHFGTQASGSLAFVIATPSAVLDAFGMLIANGSLPRNLLITLSETLLGLVLGVPLAAVIGYAIAKNRLLERILGPYAVGFQAVPIVAIAPILITRLGGPGIASVSMVAALIVFFPMLMATITGIRGVSPELREMLMSLRATPWQQFRWLELPSAAPSLLGGLKISVTLAVIGTVVGEAYGATAGLGYMIYSSRFMYNPAGVMVGIFTLTALALALYEIVVRLERRILRWRSA